MWNLISQFRVKIAKINSVKIYYSRVIHWKVVFLQNFTFKLTSKSRTSRVQTGKFEKLRNWYDTSMINFQELNEILRNREIFYSQKFVSKVCSHWVNQQTSSIKRLQINSNLIWTRFPPWIVLNSNGQGEKGNRSSYGDIRVMETFEL